MVDYSRRERAGSRRGEGLDWVGEFCTLPWYAKDYPRAHSIKHIRLSSPGKVASGRAR